ncbi:MAG: GHKL domain-containing protein [Flavobacteriaceae bacterium]|nr:GHKL domain-containing protein [Flavobacteriaceae bacterium]
MEKKQYIQIIIRLILLTTNGIIVFNSIMNGNIIYITVSSMVFIYQIFILINYFKNIFDDIEKAIDCLMYEDYTNTISIKKRKNTLYNKVGLLVEKHQKLSHQNNSEKIIFVNIIESLSIGILILRKDSDENIEVFQMNKAFTDFLKMPKFNNWHTLKNRIKPISTIVEKWQNIKHIISLDVNDEKESFFLKTSITKTNEYQYLILSLETIQQLIDKKEKEAWYKLMNVISHEILNTITPISSLSSELKDTLEQEELNQETLDELSIGLGIIKRRSQHLTSFVNAYRTLAELPIPDKKNIDIKQLTSEVITLFGKEFSKNKISIKLNSIDGSIILADKQQIEQVLINLIQNSINALKTIEKPSINIEISRNNNRLTWSIEDNGTGIDKTIRDKIFTPYFTTRKDGSGIGLTLAKNIIEAHGGRINCTQQVVGSRFVVSLV